MSIHIPENTDISGLGHTPRSGKKRSVGATRARRNPVFTVLDFIPPERRCRNGEIVPAWDKCLEDYQISPPGQARKAEFGIGGLSKSFLTKLKASIVKKKPVNSVPAVTATLAPGVGPIAYAGGKGPLDLTNPINIAKAKICANRGLGFRAGHGCSGVIRPVAPLITKPVNSAPAHVIEPKVTLTSWKAINSPEYKRCIANGGTPVYSTNRTNMGYVVGCKGQNIVAPLITKPLSTDGHVVTQAEVDASAKHNCGLTGGTWVPSKPGRRGTRQASTPAHCRPKTAVQVPGTPKQSLFAKLRAAIAAQKLRTVATQLPGAPLIKPSVSAQQERDNVAKLNCELSGGTWVPDQRQKQYYKGGGSRLIKAHCKPKAKLSDCGCEG